MTPDISPLIKELEELLRLRIDQAKRGMFVEESVEEIANEVYRELGLKIDR